MKVALKSLLGNWDIGYALDKHMISSVYLGDDSYGHPKFENNRTEIGEATYRLKYKNDWSQVVPLAKAIAESIYTRLTDVGLLIPMAASTTRPRQPVNAVTRELGRLVNCPVFENLLFKASGGKSLKNLHTKNEKIQALSEKGFSVTDEISTAGQWNALVIDDLYHTGASMEEACKVLKTYPKIGRIYVATLTWRG